MDITQFTDPQAVINLLPPQLANWATKGLLWMAIARVLLVPIRKQIQSFADAVLEFSHRSGNTEIHHRLEQASASTKIKVLCFLLNWGLSIKLGPERSTTITTTTQTATMTTKVEAPVVEPQESKP